MKTSLIFVSTLDGKVTKWGQSNVKAWSSEEDQEHYKTIWNESTLIIMGSKTYAANPHKPSPDRLMVVMTSHPEKYENATVPGQLEFTKEGSERII